MHAGTPPAHLRRNSTMASAAAAGGGTWQGSSLQIPHGPLDDTVPLPQRLEAHTHYFDQILDMIPAKFYFKDENEAAMTWTRFHKVRVGWHGNTPLHACTAHLPPPRFRTRRAQRRSRR